MKKPFLSMTLALAAVACTSPLAPTPSPTSALVPRSEGSASTEAVTTERLRLRRVDGPDIVTGLTSGQVITVPLNVKLDIWGEIRRLEFDRARLVVDWGNGNQDFSGCGSCRLENTYTRAGRFPVRAQVIDLNAPSGSASILDVNVVLVVPEPTPVASATPCTSTVTAFVGNLNGSATASAFETGAANTLPSLGWSNVSGAAQIWDLASNGALIGTTPWGNYEVQHDTGVAVLPDTTYTLQFDMGYLAGIAGGNSGFRYQIGTWNGASFTGFGAPITGTAPYAGNINGGSVSAVGLQTFTTGAVAPGGTLAVRWAQISTLGAGFSDFFGIDKVKLSATRCAP
jgi:hypothetical protein